MREDTQPVKRPVNGKKKKKKSRIRRRTKALLTFTIILLVILLIIIGVAIYASKLLGKVQRFEIDRDKVGINSGLSKESIEKMDNYMNIAVFGLDNRGEGGVFTSGNSDVIIIASINKETLDVKLVSVYRDTFFDVGKDYGGFMKCNAAYNRGGPQNAIAMLNRHLDLDITDFIALDWNAVSDLIDDLGGIEIEITKDELNYINFYIDEINDNLGKNSANIYEAGKQTLDGVQATAYCRIRYTAGSDYVRAMRHRIVMEATLKKAKTSSVPKLLGIVDSMADKFATSYSNDEIISLASQVMKYNIVETAGFPFELSCQNIYCGYAEIPISLTNNAKQLHMMLFGDDKYEPTGEVKALDQQITKLTGVDSKTETDYDQDKYNDTVGKDSVK